MFGISSRKAIVKKYNLLRPDNAAADTPTAVERIVLMYSPSRFSASLLFRLRLYSVLKAAAVSSNETQAVAFVTRYSSTADRQALTSLLRLAIMQVREA